MASQVLEGAGNHYHFVVPGDMTINATRLLADMEQASTATSSRAMDPSLGGWSEGSDAWIPLQVTQC
jgi:hypothetical protein